MNNPYTILILATAIGIVAGLLAGIIATLKALQKETTNPLPILISAAFLFVPLMSKAIYAFFIFITTQDVAETALGILPIAGIVFGVVALAQGLVGAIFMKRSTDSTRVPFRLMVTGAIETIATLTMVFTIIQTTNS
jgi:hypothetical protein